MLFWLKVTVDPGKNVVVPGPPSMEPELAPPLIVVAPLSPTVPAALLRLRVPPRVNALIVEGSVASPVRSSSEAAPQQLCEPCTISPAPNAEIPAMVSEPIRVTAVAVLAPIQAKSAAPGTALADQLAAVSHRLSPAVPVQVSVHVGVVAAICACTTATWGTFFGAAGCAAAALTFGGGGSVGVGAADVVIPASVTDEAVAAGGVDAVGVDRDAPAPLEGAAAAGRVPATTDDTRAATHTPAITCLERCFPHEERALPPIAVPFHLNAPDCFPILRVIRQERNTPIGLFAPALSPMVVSPSTFSGERWLPITTQGCWSVISRGGRARMQ